MLPTSLDSGGDDLSPQGASAGAAASAPPGSTNDTMRTLASLVEEAEALEAAGKYREAAELTARAMTQAHVEYVQTAVPADGVRVLRLLPMVPMPRRSYVERYKARLRVDWQKWDRVSRRMPVGDAGSSDDEGEGGGGGGGPTGGPSAGSLAAVPEAAALDGTDSGRTQGEGSASESKPADEWQPETLATQEAAGASGVIELVHTCCDGSRVVTSSIVRPDVPERAVYRFNRDQKHT